MLISGHRGTGKSTELKRLCRKYTDRLEILEASTLNASDAAAEDLFVLCFDAVARSVAELSQGLGRSPAVRGAAEAIKKAEARVSAADRQALKFDSKVALNIFGVASTELRLQSGLRARLRELTQRHQKDWIADFNEVVAHLRDATGTPIVLVADELDKLEGASRDAVFGPGLEYIRDLDVAAFITVPISVCYDPNFATVHAIPHRVGFNHIKLKAGPRDETPFEPGRALMRQIARRRVPPSILPDDVLDLAVTLSGGSLDQFGLLLTKAIFTAYSSDTHIVTADDLAWAARESRHDMLRYLGTNETREQLREVRRLHTRDGLDLSLLERRAVLEYPNDDPWYDVNPLLTAWVGDVERPTP